MYQQHTILGNVGRQPDLRFSAEGRAVCNFSVATTKKWKDKITGEQREKTTWYKVACWSALAETVGQYVTKGSRVLVSGEDMTAESWTDRDGKAQSSLVLTANTVRFIGDARGQAETDNTQNYEEADDIPF